MKKSEKLRLFIPIAVILIVAVGFLTNWGLGTISAPGIADISILCPLGALGTMIASKTLVPRAVVSLIIVAVLVVIFARTFCGWICPVPLVSKLRDIFKANPKQKKAAAEQGAAKSAQELTEEEKALLKTTCGSDASCSTSEGCASCTAKRGDHVDTRHFVLGGALVSTFAFGFPVFCLICPIGLTFAFILLVMNLFMHGDVTWTIVVVAVLLSCEVIFFRKWCTKLCPLSALMSLVGKANKTFVPTIDDKKCLETTRGASCGKCAKVCPEGIDIRHPEKSSAALSECLKCRACVENCPGGAITMPFLPVKKGTKKPDENAFELAEERALEPAAEHAEERAPEPAAEHAEDPAADNTN